MAKNEDFFQQCNELESAKDIPTKAGAKAELEKSLSELLNGLDFLANSQPETYGNTARLAGDIAGRIVNCFTVVASGKLGGFQNRFVSSCMLDCFFNMLFFHVFVKWWGGGIAPPTLTLESMWKV